VFHWINEAAARRDAILDAALDELDHVRQLGLCGVEIGTDGGGREFDDPVLLPFFEQAERPIHIRPHKIIGPVN